MSRLSSPVYLALVFVIGTVVSSVAAEPRFQPGELLVGYATSNDRDTALKRLSGAKDVLRVRGERLVGVEFEPIADKAVKLHLTFPAPVLSVTHNNPSEEIAVLQDVAKQIKDADKTVQYAHPNWIAEIEMKTSLQPEKLVVKGSHHARRHVAKAHRMASHRRSHTVAVAWEHHHRRARGRRWWSSDFSWPFSFSSHCWSETRAHTKKRALHRYPRNAMR
jgi:hypothetical protein